MGVLSNTTIENIENIENHVSIYAEQEAVATNNLGLVAMSTNSSPIARGSTVTNSYYLSHGETAGTMTHEVLMSGEAAQLLNDNSGLRRGKDLARCRRY